MPNVRPVPPPPPESYAHVMRRYDRHASMPLVFATYDLRLTAKPVDMHGQVAPTLFFPAGSELSVVRARRLGWVDETEAFRRHVRGEAPIGKKPAPAVEMAKPDPVVVQAAPAQESVSVTTLRAAAAAAAVGVFDSGVTPVKRPGRPKAKP
ncbi:MAG: hypothetical protein KGS10_05535 [Chloroflexi bacterium]|nr:hypothetical protein [Chloroflexota bacterium]